MEILQITDSSSALMTKIRDLYMSSFPECERRPWTSIIEMIDNKFPFFTMNAILDEERIFTGFITLWKLPDTHYVEHFAITRDCRGKGIGSKTISEIVTRSAGMPVVLEVELPGDSPEADKRIKFYQHNGFTAMDQFPYYQPPYTPELETVPMMLMTSAPLPDPERFVIMLHTLVYNQ